VTPEQPSATMPMPWKESGAPAAPGPTMVAPLPSIVTPLAAMTRGPDNSALSGSTVSRTTRMGPLLTAQVHAHTYTERHALCPASEADNRPSSEGAIGFCRRRKPPEGGAGGRSPNGAEGTPWGAVPSGLAELLLAIRRLTPPAEPFRPFGTSRAGEKRALGACLRIEPRKLEVLDAGWGGSEGKALPLRGVTAERRKPA